MTPARPNATWQARVAWSSLAVCAAFMTGSVGWAFSTASTLSSVLVEIRSIQRTLEAQDAEAIALARQVIDLSHRLGATEARLDMHLEQEKR